MTNVIKQYTGEFDGMQTIKMVVCDNERGAQGEQGEPGPAATIQAGNVYLVNPEVNPAVINSGTSSAAVFDFYLPKGPKGDPGAIHYVAGTGIQITDGNVIQATGAAVATWGGVQGNINDQTDLQQEFALYTKTSGLASVATSGAYGDLTGTPALATVATSGSYDDLTSTPTIGDATISITNNGSAVDSFTTNQTSNDTIALSYPEITMQTTDPGEGATLAANHFIGVYNA